MISWMQKHKRWLIITIWISTIAFVGAGFVGWGSYNYGKSSSTVAIVGDTEVPLSDLQSEYSALYSQYQQILGSQFNNELAKQLKLEDIAYQKTIQKYLLLQFAKELGLEVTKEEVAKELLKIKAFYKDGKFDKNTYLTVLKQNRQTAAKFEEQLRKDLLVSKVQKFFTPKLLRGELDGLKALFYSKDKVSIAIIDAKDIKVDMSEKLIKAYYEKNKKNYKSLMGYKISYTKIENIDGNSKKQMKKVALKEYLKLKKSKKEFQSTTTIYKDGDIFSNEEFTKIIKASLGKVLKPLYSDGNYYVVKLVAKIEPQILPYAKVKDIVKADYLAYQTQLLMDKKAQALVKNFKGKSLGYISRESQLNIKGLSPVQSPKLLSQIFQSDKRRGVVKLGDKVVVFNIDDSKLADDVKSIDDGIVQNIAQSIKNNVAMEELLKQLQLKYEIKSFMGK